MSGRIDMFCRDHFCHLYGPAVLYEPSGKAKEIFGSKEDLFDNQRDEDDEDDYDDDEQEINDSESGGVAVGLLTQGRQVGQIWLRNGNVAYSLFSFHNWEQFNYNNILQLSVVPSATYPVSPRAQPPPNIISPTYDSFTSEGPVSAPPLHQPPPPHRRSFSVRASFRSRQRAVTLPKSGSREERQYLRQTLRRNQYK